MQRPSRLIKNIVSSMMKRQGFYSTHRWLRNQGATLGEALKVLGYPNRFGMH